MAFKILLWDIDGTILNFEKAEEAAIRRGFEENGLGTCTDDMLEAYKKINKKYWEALERGEMTKEQILIGRFVEFFTKYGLDTKKADAFNRGYQVNLGDTICFNDDAYNLLKAFSKKYRQYAVTNGTAVAQHKKIEKSGIGEILEKCFISEEVGFEKPSEKFFDAVFKEIGCGDCVGNSDANGKIEVENTGILETHNNTIDKNEILIIGDSLTSDIKGGNNCGIRTCWYNPKHEDNKHELKIDFEISDLRELLQYL